MRLFIGLWPSPEVVEVLTALPRPDLPGLRWLPVPDLHVTLRFLGDVADDGVPALRADLARIADLPRATAAMGPATERLGRTRLVVPVAGVDDLAAAVVEATAAHGRPPEARPFRGHLTLARGRGRRPVPASLAGGHLAASWAVQEVFLVHSRTTATGARYDVVGRVVTGAG